MISFIEEFKTLDGFILCTSSSVPSLSDNILDKIEINSSTSREIRVSFQKFSIGRLLIHFVESKVFQNVDKVINADYS